MRYIGYDYWIELSGGTRLPTDAARSIREGVEPFGVPNVGFFELADKLAAGESFAPLIVVQGPVGLVVLEGHARLTAHALAPASAVPQKIEVLLGRSEQMADWALYEEGLVERASSRACRWSSRGKDAGSPNT